MTLFFSQTLEHSAPPKIFQLTVRSCEVPALHGDKNIPVLATVKSSHPKEKL